MEGGAVDREIELSPAAATAADSTVKTAPPRKREMWTFFGPAFVASVAYIDPGNFATNILGGSQFGYRLLWVLLWSNAMAILIQYLSAKLGIITGRTLPENCRQHFSRRMTIALWVAAEISAIATDLAEFLGAALGLDLLAGPWFAAHGGSATQSLFAAAVVATVAVFGILALDLAGFRWLERGVMVFVGIIGLCYGFEVILVHPDWRMVTFSTIVPTLDPHALSASLFAAVAMLGATVMPHVVYLHSALVQPRLREIVIGPHRPRAGALRRYLHFELMDVFAAMNGAWLINSAMIVMAAVAFKHAGSALASPSITDAYRTLGPLLGRGAAVVFAVALLCSGLSSSTVGVMAGQVIIEGFLAIRFPIFLRRLITVIPALIVIGLGWDPLRILVDSQVLLSFTLPFALIPLLILTNRTTVMGEFASAPRTRIAGWLSASIILALNAVLLVQLAWPAF